SQGLTEFFEKSFVGKGGKIVAKEGFTSGDKDFRAQLSKIKASNPDVIFMPYFFTEVALSAVQARELGITAALMGGDGWPSPDLFKLGGKAVEGGIFVNHLDYDQPTVQDYKARYRAKFGKDTELNGYLVHDAVLMLVDGLKRAGKVDGEALAKALSSTDIQGITGRIRISPATHNPEGKEAAIIQIVNGEYKFLQNYAAN
ncbi:MAG TPA: ABC transporter substrate-binding protein, partial [Magnetospirillaceae bacterium]|nr:ABC transporter substrate-binding protein [Magnetospirillaceae bacterium]